jgi:hypothetical protein
VTNRTPTDTTETRRCPAVEGGQQCVSATHAHRKMQNHRWGPRGETDQWHADGTPKDGRRPDPAITASTVGLDADSTLVVGNPDVLAAVASPGGGQATDPTPPTVPSAGAALEPSDTDHRRADRVAAGSGGGGSGRSIGRVIANTAIDAALGVPVDVQDERAHGREATELLVEAAADHWRHNRHMPADKLLDLEAVVLHMVSARGLE